jgi:DNA invertase Pin-like site-specific DNA recombinase
MKKICAVYTRKSTDERLDMEFNTLDAQRESCEAYITSQKSEGWVVSNEKYDDGGYSGGSLERPALKKLMDDIRARKVHIIVVYKIDRLTRSLMDFAKLVQVFDEYGVTFVSITQSFNTTTSMGRLTLNVLLSFAQFEREVSGERIRDKIAASKARGMWMGGVPPIGYSIENRRLIINKDEIKLAQHIFDRYLVIGNVRHLKAELDRENIKSPKRTSLTGKHYGGSSFTRGALYWILNNPVYIGKISHKGKIYDGLHDGIIPLDTWERVQLKLKDNTHLRTKRTQRRFMLQGLVYDAKGKLYSPIYTSRHNRQYCYYVSQSIEHGKDQCNFIERLPAHDLEMTVEIALKKEVQKLITEQANHAFDEILEFYGSISSHDLVRKCVERISVGLDKLMIRINARSIQKLLESYIQLKIEEDDEILEITIPFKVGKAKHGAVVIKPQGRDIFDMPSSALKKLVQGVIWRDEHFNGKTLVQIGAQEGCSDTHVRKFILHSLNILQAS